MLAYRTTVVTAIVARALVAMAKLPEKHRSERVARVLPSMLL